MKKKGSPDEIEDSAIWSSLVGNIIAIIMSAYFWFLNNGNCPKKPPNSYDTNSLNNAINDLKKMAEEIHNSTSKPYTNIESTAIECACTCTNENTPDSPKSPNSPSANVSPTESTKELSEVPKVTKGCSCQTIENMGSFRAKYTTAPYPIANSTKNQEYRPYHEPRPVKKKVKSKAKRTKPKQKKNADLEDIPCYVKCFADEMQKATSCGNKNCPIAVHYCMNKECKEDTTKKEVDTSLCPNDCSANEEVQAESSETSSINCSSSCSVFKNTKHPCSYYLNDQYNESTQVTQVTEVTETIEETEEIKEFEQEESQTDPYSVTLRNYSQTEQEYDELEEGCTPCYNKRQYQEAPCTPKSGPSHYSGNAYIDQPDRPKPATIQYAPNYYMNQQPVQSHQGYVQQPYSPMNGNSTDRGYRTLGVAPTAANYLRRIPQCEMNEQYKNVRQRQLGVQKSNFPPDYYGSPNARAVQPGAYMNLMINSPYNEKTINNQSLNRNEAYPEPSNSYPYQRPNFTNCSTTCPNRRPLGGQQQQPLSLMPNGAIPIRSSQNTLSVQKCSK